MTVHEFLRDSIDQISLEWLHARCADVDGCLVWKLAAAHGTDPQARIGGAEGGTILVRRAVWELAHERPFPKNHVARCSCATELCVHPEHIVPVSKTQLQRGNHLPVTQRARIAQTKRARSSLSQENVAFIRTTSGPTEELAQMFGIDPTYVSHIRLGKARIDYATPFQGLGAR